MLRKQIIFTEDEWNEFRRRLSAQLHTKAISEFRLIDRETGSEITERLNDYCWGQMALMIDEALNSK